MSSSAPAANVVMTPVALAVRTAIVIFGVALPGLPALAQTAPAPQASADAAAVQSVTVTARKREERGQDVPQSLSVFSGETLEATGVTQLEDLQYLTPGLKVSNGLGSSTVSIRGVSNNASQRGGGPSTAVHFDGVYVPRPVLAAGEVFDLNRVEVLKGPEGTLYGRNATAGVINYLTRDPGPGARFDGFIGAGTNGLIRAQAGLNVGLGDGNGLRISMARARDDGYTENIGSGGGRLDARDFSAVRLKGVFRVSRDTQIKLTVQGVQDDGTQGLAASHNPATKNALVVQLGAPQRLSPRQISLDTAPDSAKRGTLVSFTVDSSLGGAIDFKSITGYVDFTSRTAVDADGTGGFIENSASRDRSRFMSQEFQLSGRVADIAWTSGIYFSREKTSGTQSIVDSSDYPFDVTPIPFFNLDYDGTSRSSAIFGEATWAMTPQTSLLLGARYSNESLSGSSKGSVINFSTFRLDPFSGANSVDSSRFTPKLLVQHKLGPQGMVYASVTSGFKSGGINYNPPVVTYKPEKIVSYELGTKQQFLGGTMEVDAAAFYYDYTDLQLRTVVGNQSPISNVAKASVQGLEFSLIGRPTRDLSLDLAVAYVDSELKSYVSPATKTDLSGMPLPLTPRTSATAGAEWRTALAGGRLSLRAEVNHQTEVIFPALQNPTFERQGPVTLVNASARYTMADQKTYVALIGRNLTDKTYLNARNYSRGFGDFEVYGAPRTLELRAGTKF